MKKLIALSLASILLTGGLFGCGGSSVNLDRETNIGEVYYYSISSEWKELPQSYEFERKYQTNEGAPDMQILSTSLGTVVYDSNDLNIYYNLVKDRILGSDIFSNWKDISRKEMTIDEFACVVHEYSYTEKGVGDITAIHASIILNNHFIIFSYVDESRTFRSDLFYDVLNTVKIFES